MATAITRHAPRGWQGFALPGRDFARVMVPFDCEFTGKPWQHNHIEIWRSCKWSLQSSTN